MDIDSICEEVLKKLTTEAKLNEFLKKLLLLSNNGDRVFQVYDVLTNMKLLPELRVVKKCATLSTTYRNKGNNNFQSSKMYEAWQFYNLALLYAPSDTEYYKLALANRSAVLLHLEKFEECLKDIEKVLTMKATNCPEGLKDKLLKRQFLCKKMLSEYKSRGVSDELFKRSHFTLKNPRNPKYPCATDAVDVAYSEEMGYHVVAKRDIVVGEMIVEEDPYILISSKSQILFSCGYCMSRTANLLPCHMCCFHLYCSEECKEKEWNFYHKYECSILANLWAMKFTKLELTALRIVLRARCEHQNWESLLNTISNAETQLKSEYRGCIKINGEWIYDSESYMSIHTLASNVDKRSPFEILQRAVTAAIFFHMLLKHTDFLKETNKDISKCIAGLLLHHSMISSINSINLGTIDEKYMTDITLGSGVYPFCSLFNHSCAPNVERMNMLGTSKMKLITRRFIKKGMQLYDNYGPLYAVDDRRSRQNTLQLQYKFTCSCEACVHNWPTIFSLKNAENLPEDVLRKVHKVLNLNNSLKLGMGCKNTAKDIFKSLCELITVLEDHVPSKEFHECQDLFRHISTMFEGSLKQGYLKRIKWEIPV